MCRLSEPLLFAYDIRHVFARPGPVIPASRYQLANPCGYYTIYVHTIVNELTHPKGQEEKLDSSGIVVSAFQLLCFLLHVPFLSLIFWSGLSVSGSARRLNVVLLTLSLTCPSNTTAGVCKTLCPQHLLP